MNMFKLMKQVQNATLGPTLNKYASLNGLSIGETTAGTTITMEDAAERLQEAQEFIYAQFTGRDFEGKEYNVPPMQINEALNTSDVSVVFPRVISEVLQQPKEPSLFLSNQVVDEVVFSDNSPLSIEFPKVGALQAFEIAEGQDYPAQTLSITQDMTAIRLRKVGLASSLSEEVQNLSMWPLLTLLAGLMMKAIDRKQESLLYQIMMQKAQNVFDNNSTDTSYWTTGTGVAQSANGSFDYNDLVKMMAVLLGRRYQGTHFLAHPLAWPIFAQDPILKAQFYHGGQLGAGIWNRPPQFDQQAAIPFGISYVPYYALPYAEVTALTNVSSSLGTSLLTDVYVIDKANSLFLATRGKANMDQMENWYRDCTQIKARKYMGMSAKDGGYGMCSAKNLRVVANQKSIMTINTHSV